MFYNILRKFKNNLYYRHVRLPLMVYLFFNEKKILPDDKKVVTAVHNIQLFATVLKNKLNITMLNCLGVTLDPVQYFSLLSPYCGPFYNHFTSHIRVAKECCMIYILPCSLLKIAFCQIPVEDCVTLILRKIWFYCQTSHPFLGIRPTLTMMMRGTKN